jgi:hypothetical protein
MRAPRATARLPALEDQGAGALADDQPVAVDVEGARALVGRSLKAREVA